MKAEITYLYNSGFALKTDRHLFIFDYYLDSPKGCGLAKGVIDPEEIKDLNVVVFVSHSHPDHYNPKIFSWRKTVGQIQYVLSDDIKTTEDVIKVGPGREYNLGDLRVRTLESTDIGVAFLILVDGLCIYHAGDLNDWYWDGEPEEDNREMTRRYRVQIDTLKNESIDIAFVPVDPRLEGNALRGLGYFMEAAGAELVVPMHFSDNTSIFEELKTDSRTDSYRDRIAFYSQRGDRIPYPKSNE